MTWPNEHFKYITTAALVLLAVVTAQAQTDPLPSWNDTAPKAAVVAFIEKVTKEGSSDFVPEPERIAVFDNDGTLWTEHPMYVQLAFALDRVKAEAPSHPEWKDTQPFKAVLEGDMKTLAASGEKGVLELIMATHAGMTAVLRSPIPNLSTNRCSNCSPICALTASRPSSYPGEASR